MVGNMIVDLVNPKLKAYDKPVILAITIGSFTLACTLGLWSTMMNNCNEFASLAASEISTVDNALTNNKLGTCVTFFSKLKLLDGVPLYDECRWPEMGTYGEALPTPTMCGDQGDTYQEKELCYTDPDAQFKTPVQVMYTQCPAPFTTLGAAMGYMSFIELFFTALIILPGMKLKCIKNGEDSHEVITLKGLLFGAAGEAKGKVADGDQIYASAIDPA